MKQIKIIVVGFGDRGSIYASYASLRPDIAKVVGIVDPNTFRLKEAQKIYKLSDDQLFTDLDDCLKKNLDVDLYINGTMDQQHYAILKKLAATSKSVLTEKPIVNQKEQLLEIEKIANENHTNIYVGHVLRYTPFYKTIKQLILDGEVGEIRSMELAEHVGSAHYAGSYLRGKWNNEEQCGSTLLLAKSCHDVDLICWLNNVSSPRYVSSFGGRHYFKEENAPKDATEFCYNCPHERECYYSAIKLYFENNYSAELTYVQLNKENITDEDKMNFLKTNNFGRCVYKIKEANVVDRQVMNIEFNNGSVATFTLTGGVPEAMRTISIVGTKGEITGKFEEGLIYVKHNQDNSLSPKVQIIDINKQIRPQNSGHFGGDYEIMDSVIQYLLGDKSSISITKLSDSVNGHLCVYAADESRLTKKIIEIKGR